MINEFNIYDQGFPQYIPQKYMNKWIEVGLSNDFYFKFFLTYWDNHYLGGYLSRNAYNTLYCVPTFTNQSYLQYGPQNNLPQYTPNDCINSWVQIGFENARYLKFYLTSANENDIGGFLLQNSIKNLDFSIVQFQEFFEEYENQFHPMLINNNIQLSKEEKTRRIQVINDVYTILLARLLKRGLASKEGGRIPKHTELPNAAIDDIQYLSNKLLQLYKEFFNGFHDQSNFHRFHECYELFSNGEIRGTKYPGQGQPDSSDEFLFSEFAIQAIELNIDVEIWCELLKTFVKSQEIFIQVYRPKGIEVPTLEDYTFSNFQYFKQVSQNEKERLRKKYDKMSFYELIQAYSRNLLKAQSP
ncbi:hypothetical protein PH210_05670 [Paenibacillus sp. BSR1-1]|uniref:hypothetical protein n=1 Tax=Paenibacillus sp. BSR1-1 TaxID=3020845 RepID=UPI0025AEF478|nr:hypothetical protein [Paenibacillus sp. BSR1-1]MDN3015697.1 hypothetical protein [Paenibacillus sp. BSR1-1]